MTTQKIDNIVKSISKNTQGGNTFFDQIDKSIKNPKNLDITLDLFRRIYDDFGLKYNLVISGGFGDLVMFLLKRGDIKCKGTILQLSGGLTSHFTDMDKIKKSKEVIIQKQIGEINNKDFIFVDDSFYSGTTGYSIDNFLKKIGSKIIKTYVVYDGNDTKSPNRISLYNYYDWNVGSQRTIEELMNELEKWKDIPNDIFEKDIMKGEIKSIIQLRKKINEFKIKSSGKGIDVYSRVRENKIFNFKKFNESKSDIYFGYGWKEYNPEEERIVAEKIWRYKLGNEFNCLIRLSNHEPKNYIIYLEEPDGTLNFMDYLTDPFIFKKYNKSYTEFAISICKDQLEYYNKLENLPSEEEVKSNLYIFTDEDLELKSEIKYGYAYKIFKEDEYDLVSYHRQFGTNQFICAFILGNGTWKGLKDRENEIKKMIEEFQLLINFDTDFRIKIKYYLDSRGLVIILDNLEN